MVDADHVCLVKNDRHAIGKTLLEVPAGTIDEGESPDQTAERELAEETGFRAGRITRVRDWFVSPGVMTERMFLYLCEDLVAGPTDHQPDERLETVILPWKEALAMAYDGRIQDAKSILALLICDRLRARPGRNPWTVPETPTSCPPSTPERQPDEKSIQCDVPRGPIGLLATAPRGQPAGHADPRQGHQGPGPRGEARRSSHAFTSKAKGRSRSRAMKTIQQRDHRRGARPLPFGFRGRIQRQQVRGRHRPERRQGMAEVRRPEHGDGARRRQERETNIYLMVVPAAIVPLKSKDFKVEPAADEKVKGKPAAALKVTGPTARTSPFTSTRKAVCPSAWWPR